MSADLATPILVVEDSSTMGRIIADLLHQIGFQNVDLADGGASALARMRKTPYGLAISDWNMRPMTGLDLLKQIRSDSAFTHTRFIMITAESNREHVLAAKDAGADGYIVKPLTAQVLKAKLDSILADRRKEDDGDYDIVALD